MRMDMKLVSFVLILTVVLLEAKINFWEDLQLAISRKAIFNYLFAKTPNVVRVRKPEKIVTQANYVTTLDFIGLVERYGYPAEEHYVTTEDGYNLVIHRISGSPLSNNQQRKKVIFLQHGLLGSSDSWVSIGAGKDLAFLLADQGYDVWVGNVRGNSYCRSHVKLSPQNKDFWQFSYDEIGTKDLPVMIDYVLSNTKQKTLRYVGHSMGTTTLFILLSTKPEYNVKIKLGILLAPVGIWKEISTPVEHIYNRIPKLKGFLDSNGIYEIATLSSKSISIGRTLCSDTAVTQAVCIAIFFLLSGSDPAQLNTTMLPEILSHFPSGASVQTFHHFYQNIATQKFQAYDYGYFNNYKQYGQSTPLIYDLKKVTAPMALFYGDNDQLDLKSSVLETSKHLPNIILLEQIPYKLFTHLDFLWATDGKALLYDRVIEVLEELIFRRLCQSMNSLTFC
ncbi:PREDICTED: lipase 3-like [Vollenhovia emeryi]|uniref:lipase 3-like n=1 Tax=Vollenhovia emeryi TaxID=411798 RepID=UPI0005F42AF4|nr:PREDICTED: lipase 3-like [Vollenhovia emeryi]XP_011866797.1 PREDICTED: lipase 3-like [Vollenhovia emeryi]